LALENVGPFVKVPLFPPREISFHAVLPLTYDFVLAASKFSTNPLVTIFGPPVTVLML
jgi:hypothetical protein